MNKEFKEKMVNVYEEYVWVVCKKRTGSIVNAAGINFETEKNKCPESVKINPIYADEYENVRIKIIHSHAE